MNANEESENLRPTTTKLDPYYSYIRERNEHNQTHYKLGILQEENIQLRKDLGILRLSLAKSQMELNELHGETKCS